MSEPRTLGELLAEMDEWAEDYRRNMDGTGHFANKLRILLHGDDEHPSLVARVGNKAEDQYDTYRGEHDIEYYFDLALSAEIAPPQEETSE